MKTDVICKPTPGGGSSSSDRRRLKGLAAKMYLRRTRTVRTSPDRLLYDTLAKRRFSIAESILPRICSLSFPLYRAPLLPWGPCSGAQATSPPRTCPFSRPSRIPNKSSHIFFPFVCWVLFSSIQFWISKFLDTSKSETTSKDPN